MAAARKRKSSSSPIPSHSPSSSKIDCVAEKGQKKAARRQAQESHGPSPSAGDTCATNSKRPKKAEDIKITASETKKSTSAESSRHLRSTISDDEHHDGSGAIFIGDPLPEEESIARWPKRYYEKLKKKGLGSNTKPKSNKDDDEEIIQASRHYSQAEVDGCVTYNLFDDAHVKATDGEPDYICKIVEMFEAIDGLLYFTAQWYYRAKDTVIQKQHELIDEKRVFFSEVRDDNPLDCLVGKISVARVPLNVDLVAKEKSLPPCDYYCDMLYLLPYTTFINLPSDYKEGGSDMSSTISSDNNVPGRCDVSCGGSSEPHTLLLDLYSGCGAMSTGLCHGAQLNGLNLVTRWAVDLNEFACQSLKLNHPETEVRNEPAEDFLALLKEWEKLCIYFNLIKNSGPQQFYERLFRKENEVDVDEEDSGDVEDEEIFEVSEVLDIRYGDRNKKEKNSDPSEEGETGGSAKEKDQLFLKVRWKGYGPEEDTWEPIEGLGNCKECIKKFVVQGYNSKLLPLPGSVDVICGGPPCQGVSGYNRFRNLTNPLDDDKNKQLVVYMDLVQYLKPKLVLMENVVDIFKFADGYLGRYALGRLVQMNYQTRMGMMAAGAYGLPQFRMRCFIWGAHPDAKLPSYPLPTHDVVVRGVIPLEFEMNTVAYDEGQRVELREKLHLLDAISDLPRIDNDESRDEMTYHRPPKTGFQHFIRSSMDGSLGKLHTMLYDHRPLRLNEDDYQRVCRIPKKKGANFRDLPGVRVRSDNKVEWDPSVKRVYLDSGKPLVPNYAMSFVDGSSCKPFARLWWDETVPTVVTRAEPHNQAILHPEQDRVLSIRENARLQGFPDHYKLCGPVKQRYIQVGNAVAVPVARALGYALASSFTSSTSKEPLTELPRDFPTIRDNTYSASSDNDS